MTDIRTTLNDALPAAARSYPQYIDTAVTALEGREEQIKEGLRSYAQGRGLSDSEIGDLFVQVGLTERAVEEPTANNPVLEAVGAIRSEVESLLQRLNALV